MEADVLSTQTDEQLMQHYAELNDMEAFKMLYERYKNILYRYVLRFVYPPASAEEVYQDVWLRLIDARQRYKPSASFKTYLFTIARNRITDYFRRKKIQLVSDEGVLVDMAIKADPVDADDPVAILQADHTQQQILQAVFQLPHEQKEVFLLKNEVGLSLAEISALTDADVEACKSRYRYAIRSLRKQLEVGDHDAK
ncbi:MAG: sigma-70 family RNA polymerase sigma factor [Gammaproteobacteria bacterium]|nr:sigma-70 family RNA polymerase sigma factor [Gammaproteobacteria bacterium]